MLRLQGQVHFNQGLIYAFLFRKKWYPLRAIVNYANQTNHLTKTKVKGSLLVC